MFFLLLMVNGCQKCAEGLEENRLSENEYFDFKSIHSRTANIEMLKSKVSSENYYLHDFGAQTSSNISEHDLIYGFELINNYVQGADNDFIIVACGLSGKDVASVQTCMGLLQREKLKKTVNYIIIPMMNPLEYEKYIDATAKSVDSLKNYFGAGKSRPESRAYMNYINLYSWRAQVVISSMPEDGFEIKPYTITVPFSKDNRFMNELEFQITKTNDIEKILSDGHILHWALKDSFDESEQIRESMLYSLQVNLNSSIDAFDRNLSEAVKILNFVADEIVENKFRS